MAPGASKLDPSLGALGEVVEALRREKGLAQDELAELTGTDASYISLIESGKRNLSWATLTRICQGLGVQRSALMARVEKRAAEGGEAS